MGFCNSLKRFVLWVVLIVPSVVWGQIQTDTLRPNANGGFNNWDDNNTAGCAATASNYLRVNTNSTSDTLSVDAIVAVCNTGNQFESHNVADFNRTHSTVDTVRCGVKSWGTITTDSLRIGLKVGNDTIWSALFQLTTTPTFYYFTSALAPDGSGWDDGVVDATEICTHTKLATVGRIWDTEEVLIVRSQPPVGGSGPSQLGASRFYLPSSGTSPVTNIAYGFGLSTKWSDTTRAGDGGGGFNWRNKLIFNTASNTNMTTRSENNDAPSAGATHALGQWISDPIGAQTIHGGFKGQMRGVQNVAATNARLAICVYVITKTGTLRGVPLPIASADAPGIPPEFAADATAPLVFTNRSFLNSLESAAIVLTRVQAQDSDRIVVEVGYQESGTTATDSANILPGDPTHADSVDLPENQTNTVGKSWIEFREGIVFFAAGISKDTLTVQNTNGAVWTRENPGCITANINLSIDEGEPNNGETDFIITDEATGGACLTGPGIDRIILSDFNSAHDSILKVEVVTYVRGNALEAADSFRVFAATTADKYAPALAPPGASYVKEANIFTNKPGGGNWVDTAVDSLKLGVQSHALANAGEYQRVTLGYAVVYYQPASAGGGDNPRRQRSGN